jgi:hypothetical protein
MYCMISHDGDGSTTGVAHAHNISGAALKDGLALHQIGRGSHKRNAWRGMGRKCMFVPSGEHPRLHVITHCILAGASL